MKGIVFNLLEEVVTAAYDEDAWDDVLDAAGADGAYTAIGSYGDHDFTALLANLPLGAEVDDRLRWFGRAAMPLLAGRYPVFFEGHTDARSFLLTLNDVVHPEVRKLYPGADVPVFDFDTAVTGAAGSPTVVMGYHSTRQLCMLAEGFVHGAADYFGERVEISQETCMRFGAQRCLIECTFHPSG